MNTSMSIIACPSCNALVLPDTAQCPNCGHVFDEKRAMEPTPASPPVEPTEEEIPCPGCNELVRKGLVRCWNCGTFMQQDTAESFRRMQVSPPRVIYSSVEPPPTDGFTGQLTDSGRLIDQPETPASDGGDDDADFDVSDEIGPGQIDEGDFDLGSTESPIAPNELLQSAPVYTLKTEPEPSPAKTPERPAASPSQQVNAPKGGPPAQDEKTPKSGSQPEFSNEFEDRFGIDDQAIATGDGLLRVALAEEAETGVRRRGQKLGEGGRAGFRVYCPNGHCIEVQERHRGRTGRCPRCRELFVVPADMWDEEKAQQEDEVQKVAAITASVNAGDVVAGGNQPVEVSAGEYTRWMLDSHYHSVDLTKLKLKTGSLINDFQEADIGFAPDGMLIVLLAKKGGLFGGGGAKKKLSSREAVLDHLSKGKARDELPCGAKHFFAAATIPQFRIVQPIVSTETSMFAGVPVFGDARIAVRLPKRDEIPHPQFLSFTLSEFRRFSKILAEFYGLRAFGDESGVPLEDLFTERFCHYSDQPLKILENIDYYKNDPGFKVRKIGYKCAGCGLVISEESREKEKIGGKDAKKIAKVKCPKCQKPFGDLPLYSLDLPAAPT